MGNGTLLKVSILGLFLLLIGLIVIYVLEFPYFSNTFEVEKLVYASLAVGLIIGLALAMLLGRHIQNDIDRYRVWALFIVFCTGFAPLFGSLTNRLLSPYDVQNQQFQFIAEESYAASRYGFIVGEKVKAEGYFIYVIKDDKVERLKSKQERFRDIPENTQIDLPVRKGLFGFEFIEWD